MNKLSRVCVTMLVLVVIGGRRPRPFNKQSLCAGCKLVENPQDQASQLIHRVTIFECLNIVPAFGALLQFSSSKAVTQGRGSAQS